MQKFVSKVTRRFGGGEEMAQNSGASAVTGRLGKVPGLDKFL